MPINTDLPGRQGERGGRNPLLGDAGGIRDGAEAVAEGTDAEAAKLKDATTAILPEKAEPLPSSGPRETLRWTAGALS